MRSQVAPTAPTVITGLPSSAESWEMPTEPVRLGRDIPVDTSLYSAVVSETGGGFKSFRVKGIRGEPFSMINANIVAGAFGLVYIAYPTDDNGGCPYGLTADLIGQLTIRSIDGIETFRNLDIGPFNIDGDVEIRLA